MKRFQERLEPVVLNGWRIVVGFLFFTHGGQKLMGWFGRDAVASWASLMGLAGFLELFGGLAILLGVGTRYVSFVLAGEMAVAYWYSHVGRGGLWPWANGGELAALYCFSFLLMTAIGGGRFSIDGLRARRSATGSGPTS